MHLVLVIKTNHVAFRTSDGRSGSEPHKHDLVQVSDAIGRIKRATCYGASECDSEETIWDV